MIVYDIFCGTKSFAAAAVRMGHRAVTLDVNPAFDPDVCIDFMDWDYHAVDAVDHIHFSPDCATFSMANANVHFDAHRQPKTQKAVRALETLERMKACLRELLARFPHMTYTIENPRARMRWFMDEFPRVTVSYCQYAAADETRPRMKPTDIWTNLPFEPRMCRNGAPCHVAAPRGSYTGTQGMSRVDKGRIPENLVRELLRAREGLPSSD